jgi:hypothetical protein
MTLQIPARALGHTLQSGVREAGGINIHLDQEL